MENAAKNGNLAEVQRLVREGANVNARIGDGRTAAHCAAWNGHVPVLQFLAEHGADINNKDKGGRTAAHYAAENDHVPVLQFLAEHGADINIKDKPTKALTEAAVLGTDIDTPQATDGRTQADETKEAEVRNQLQADEAKADEAEAIAGMTSRLEATFLHDATEDRDPPAAALGEGVEISDGRGAVNEEETHRKRESETDRADATGLDAMLQSSARSGGVAFTTLVARSKQLPYWFPTRKTTSLEAVCASSPQMEKEAETFARGTRPIVHHRVKAFLSTFLLLKQASGTDVETKVYGNISSEADLITRLLTKRPLVFFNRNDQFLLPDGSDGASPEGFDRVGSEKEQAPLVLRDVQSYSEMQLSALLGVSVPTHFVNEGSRGNQGRVGQKGSFQRWGISVGLVGARFERQNRMEWQHVIVTEQQNTMANGYGHSISKKHPLLAAWAKFYGLKNGFPLFSDACSRVAAEKAGKADNNTGYIGADGKEIGRFVELQGGWQRVFLDTLVYRERMRISVETFLAEAEERAKEVGQQAFVHIVGLGLGVWQVHPAQKRIFVDLFAETVANASFSHISDLNFSWFKGLRACGGVEDGGFLPTQGGGRGLGVRVWFNQRNPADRLTGENENKLLVAMYAWDSNAFPGNEYWLGMLAASGDPAAACSCSIPELQNPHVNTEAMAGSNARVAIIRTASPAAVGVGKYGVRGVAVMGVPVTSKNEGQGVPPPLAIALPSKSTPLPTAEEAAMEWRMVAIGEAEGE